MRKNLFAYILIISLILGCSNQADANESVLDNPNLNPIDNIEPTPEPTEVPTPIQKESSGEMKYNHPKIIGDVDEVGNLIDEIEKLSSGSKLKFSIFLQALEITGMDQEIISLDEMTLLVPTDEAFNSKFKLEEISNLISDKILLSNIINSHLLPYKFKEKNMKKFSHLDTFSESLDIDTINKKIIINENINILSPDNEVSNGFFHVINSVIIPLDIESMDQSDNNLGVSAEIIPISELVEKDLFVESLIKGSDVYNFSADFTLNIQFNEDGNYSGKFLCNQIFGAYTLSEEGYLLINQGASTKMFCIPPDNDIELNTQEIWEFILNENIEILASNEDGKVYFKSIDGYLILQEN